MEAEPSGGEDVVAMFSDDPSARTGAEAGPGNEDGGEDAMDLAEGPSGNGKKKRKGGEGLKPVTNKRGQRSKVQKQRKLKGLEKALQVTERKMSKVGKVSNRAAKKQLAKRLWTKDPKPL